MLISAKGRLGLPSNSGRLVSHSGGSWRPGVPSLVEQRVQNYKNKGKFGIFIVNRIIHVHNVTGCGKYHIYLAFNTGLHTKNETVKTI